MTMPQVIRQVDQLLKQYGTRDPEVLTEAQEILLRFLPLGRFPDACKGFFIVHRRQRHITINSDLSGPMQRVTLAHELGHALLHNDCLELSSYHDIDFFTTPHRDELEANLFAAELLISDEAVLQAAQEGLDFMHLSQELMVPPALLDFKLRILQHKGYPSLPPHLATGDFLKESFKDQF